MLSSRTSGEEGARVYGVHLTRLHEHFAAVHELFGLEDALWYAEASSVFSDVVVNTRDCTT